MEDEKPEERKRNLLDSMAIGRGYSGPPWWPYLGDKDIEFLEAYNNLYQKCLMDGKVLPIKIRELIAIGIIAFKGYENGVYEHIKRALKHGATKQEVLEAIETTIIPGGAHTFAIGMRALIRVDEENKKGI